MSYPDYGTPGNPNMDPYYMTPAQEAAADAQAEDAIALAKYDQAVGEGEKAREDGLPRTACPYQKATDPLREGWLDGWDH